MKLFARKLTIGRIPIRENLRKISLDICGDCPFCASKIKSASVGCVMTDNQSKIIMIIGKHIGECPILVAEGVAIREAMMIAI